MKKLLTLMLLLTVSSVSAQQADLMAGPQVTSSPVVLGTPVPTGTVTVISSTPFPSTTPVFVATQISSTPIVGTPVPGAISAGATPILTPIATSITTASGTPSVLPKPPALGVAATPALNNAVGEHLVFQIDGGVVPSVSSSAASVLGTGFGFDGRFSFAADDVFSIGLESGYYSFGVNVKNTSLPSNATSSLTEIPLLIAMQVNLGDSGGLVQPYFVLAGGLAIDAYTLTGAAFAPGVVSSWTNFELAPAVGVGFPLDRSTALFVQAKWIMDFGDNSSSNAESADSPIMFVPIQAGVNFNL
jgi:hypothetical protein